MRKLCGDRAIIGRFAARRAALAQPPRLKLIVASHIVKGHGSVALSMFNELLQVRHAGAGPVTGALSAEMQLHLS
ncbi:hypothetical protein [Phenylobacterium sp.]|uniref:hypothetical protein n=1 Tax=Phenylobacterium sp. TaxID=1871053 RepID=UPI0027325DFD|nr:hypothetical protein [Phenylobacterium sp.]